MISEYMKVNMVELIQGTYYHINSYQGVRLESISSKKLSKRSLSLTLSVVCCIITLSINMTDPISVITITALRDKIIKMTRYVF